MYIPEHIKNLKIILQFIKAMDVIQCPKSDNNIINKIKISNNINIIESKEISLNNVNKCDKCNIHFNTNKCSNCE